MTKQEFEQEIIKEITQRLGEGYQVKLQEILKNNGVRLTGLLIREEDSDIAPTLYLDDFYEKWQGGKYEALEDVVEQIMASFYQCEVNQEVNMEFYHDFQKVKDRLCYKLISIADNQELLEDIPWIPYLDMAICFYYSFDGPLPGLGSILIHDSHMKLWQTTVEELYGLAKENTKNLFPAKLVPIKDLLEDMMMEMQESEDVKSWMEPFDTPMYVLTNSEKYFGACCILYEGLLEDISKKLNNNFYILPSSIHEIIVLADNDTYEKEFLRNMVCEVNMTQVDRQEVLTNSIYYYNYDKKKIEMV